MMQEFSNRHLKDTVRKILGKPRRIQLRRTRGWRMPANTVKVDRSSKWFGNPFPVIDPWKPNYLKLWRKFGILINQEMAVDLFKSYVKHRPRLRTLIRRELRGKNVGCWCKPGDPCHGDVLLKIANS